MRRSVLVAGGVGVAVVVAGCQAVPDDVAADYASRHATSSHLANASTVPITYLGEDPHKELVLQPGGQVTLSGGAWAVPVGWRCTWRFTEASQGVGVTTVGSDDFVAWTTFGGYDETVISCTGPAS